MKQTYTFCFLFFFIFQSWAQTSPSVTKYDLKKKRLLIQSSSMYLYNSNQGAIDVDSSVVLACKAYKLPVSLAYDEGFNDGSYLIGKDLIEKSDVNSVKRLLAKSKGEDAIKLSLQLGNFYLFKPGTKPEDLKNAFLYIEKAVSVSNQLKARKWQNQSLILLGKYYTQANNPIESKNCFVQVINDCKKQNDKLGLADALDAQGTLLSNLDPEKEKILQEAVSLYASLRLEEKRIESYMKITTIYFWTARIDEARKRLYQNLIDLRKIGFTHQQFAETTIAYIELTHRSIKTALYYALKSVKRMETEKDYTFGEVFYLRLGDVYNIYGHNEAALEMYKKGIDLGHQNIDSGTWYKSFFGAVAALSLKGKTKEALDYINSTTEKYPPKSTFDKMSVNYIKANCYYSLKDYVQAEKYFKEMDYYAAQLNTPETFIEVVHQYTQMALFYIETNRPEKAKFYSDKVFALCQTYNKNYNSQGFQYLLFKTDSVNGNYKSAIKHFENYKQISDSTLGISKNKQIEELKIEYETKNKEQKIKLLNDQSKLQESELHKSKILNNLSIWSLILLLITIALLYNRYRLKQRNHAKLELKEKEINQKNINLRHLLDEKEWLLKEIHHRVKNNLQTVISLLNSQSAYLDNDMALSAIKNSQHRIHSMSLIHQKLYNSENISTINMPNYIRELIEYLKDSFNLGQRIRFEIKIDPLELDVAQAVPLGLILNEAITNSIKYAFPDDRTGMIYITLEAITENRYLLTISDNGIGVDSDFSGKKINSFGMSLIKGLSDDLEAKFSMENDNGTILKIEFSQEFPINQKR
ncbi:two-component sensor histidine kinase [Flavobacterium sp. 9]|uniref:sensor histidine kinase n=1 Tax=Flavobacterium sp. 9 TaxID=2035198 RepID=UPI000C183073|nr:sensor histidine kinase [Flavobacterium sp. 9]PIF33284.1 two-component sensor histidine kinase [Flavobacterium sp. 9]